MILCVTHLWMSDLALLAVVSAAGLKPPERCWWSLESPTCWFNMNQIDNEPQLGPGLVEIVVGMIATQEGITATTISTSLGHMCGSLTTLAH